MTDKVTISASEYKKMQRDIAKLNALEAGGVDNWEWYGESLTEWHKENHKEELLDMLIDELNDIMVEAEVDQPAGPGCGYAITFDEDLVKKLVLKFVNDLEEGE